MCYWFVHLSIYFLLYFWFKPSIHSSILSSIYSTLSSIYSNLRIGTYLRYNKNLSMLICILNLYLKFIDLNWENYNWIKDSLKCLDTVDEFFNVCAWCIFVFHIFKFARTCNYKCNNICPYDLYCTYNRIISLTTIGTAGGKSVILLGNGGWGGGYETRSFPMSLLDLYSISCNKQYHKV